MDLEFREDGKEALETVLTKAQNVKVFEKVIFELCSKTSKNEDEIEKLYKEYIFQCICTIAKRVPLKTILANIKKNRVGWEHFSFDDVRFEIQERQEFIVTPFIVEEGILQCGKCGSKKVFSYSKQVRRADESTSVFAICANPKCGHKWQES
jgi:DNA-directed RNA polymerase subunit M/transcription elongation factor TFIIS